jgi:hypothetical protein
MDLSQLVWRKATRSSESGDNCVEVAGAPGRVALRDSKNPDDGALTLGLANFRELLVSLKHLG